jgi:hypothetical protein
VHLEELSRSSPIVGVREDFTDSQNQRSIAVDSVTPVEESLKAEIKSCEQRLKELLGRKVKLEKQNKERISQAQKQGELDLAAWQSEWEAEADQKDRFIRSLAALKEPRKSREKPAKRQCEKVHVKRDNASIGKFAHKADVERVCNTLWRLDPTIQVKAMKADAATRLVVGEGFEPQMIGKLVCDWLKANGFDNKDPDSVSTHVPSVIIDGPSDSPMTLQRTVERFNDSTILS